MSDLKQDLKFHWALHITKNCQKPPSVKTTCTNGKVGQGHKLQTGGNDIFSTIL